MDDLEKQKGTSSMLLQALKIISKPSLNSNWGDSSEMLQIDDMCPMWPWNLMDDIEKQLGTSSMLLQYLGIIS